MVKDCPECGAKIGSKSIYCNNCGKNIPEKTISVEYNKYRRTPPVSH
jgi:hypothetical protein